MTVLIVVEVANRSREPIKMKVKIKSPTLSERRVWSRRNESFPAKSFAGFTRRSMSIFPDQGRSILVVVSLSFHCVVRYQYTYYKFRDETIQKSNSAMCRIQAPLALG